MKRYVKAGVAGKARKEMMSLQKALQSAYDAVESCDPTIYDMFNPRSRQCYKISGGLSYGR